MQRWVTGILVTLLLVSMQPMRTWGAMRVFTMQHRPAADLARVIRPLLGPGGSVVADGDKLVVRTGSANLRSVARVVKQLDQPRATLRITVRQVLLRGGSVQWGTGAGGEAGATRGEENAGSEPQGQRIIGNMRQSRQQVLQVLDGESAFFLVGREIPFDRALAVMGGNRPAVAKVTGFRRISSGFAVRPTLIGNRVRLQIVPQLSLLIGDAPRILDFQRAATVVTLPLGHWRNLAADIEDAGEAGRAILSWRADPDSAGREVWVRVEREHR